MARIKMSADTKKFRKWLRTCETGIAYDLKKCLQANVEKCYEMARTYCPVDTGRLRESIHYEITNGGTVGIIATGTPYARYVEQGTVYQPAQHYMRNAWYDIKYNYVAEMHEILQDYLNNRPY